MLTIHHINYPLLFLIDLHLMIYCDVSGTTLLLFPPHPVMPYLGPVLGTVMYRPAQISHPCCYMCNTILFWGLMHVMLLFMSMTEERWGLWKGKLVSARIWGSLWDVKNFIYQEGATPCLYLYCSAVNQRLHDQWNYSRLFCSAPIIQIAQGLYAVVIEAAGDKKI